MHDHLLPNLLALSALCATPGGEPAAPPVEEAVARIYDLSGLFVAADHGPIADRAFPVLSQELEDVDEEVREVDRELPRAILRALLAGDFESEGVEVEDAGDERLILRAAPAVHQRVQTVLAELDRALAGTLELELCALRLEGASDLRAGLVPAAQAQAWIDSAAGAGRLERIVLRVGRGTAASVDVGRQVDFLGDFDVEVAEGALTFDPRMTSVLLGTRVSARASAGRDGHFVALALRRASALGPVTRRSLERSTAMLAGDAYQLNERALTQESQPVLGRSLALNAFLPAGQALVAVLDHDSAGVHEALVLRAVGGAFAAPRRLEAGPGGQALTLLDATHWSPPVAYGNVRETLGSRPEHLPRPNYDAWQVWLGSEAWNRDDDGAEPLSRALRQSAPEIERSEGGWPLLAVTLGSDSAGVLERLETFVPLGSNVEVELALRRGERVLASLALPLLVGRSSDAVLCSEDLLVCDADVEIAKYAAVDDPIQRARLEGLLVSMRPLRTPSGAILLELGGVGVAPAGARRKVELAEYGGGELEAEDQDYLFLDEQLRFESGKGSSTVRVGDGTLGLALDVTLRGG